MDDREMLVLAAKAAGMTPLPEGMEVCDAGPMSKGGIVFAGGGNLIDWNPLTDDGEALRLAVRLRLRIDTPSAGSFRLRALVQSQDRTRSVCENSSDETIDMSDPYAATRRAIVRAAAEIGKTMP